MKNELRLDRGTAGKLKRLDNGWVRVPITATRVGILVYRDAHGDEWRELRPPEEVFHADSMASLAGIPVTNDHPSVLLDANNTRDHLVGYTSSDVQRHDVFLTTQATITEQNTIEALNNGKRQASAGYKCDLDETPGVWRGERYDAVQRNIRYNHVAIVKAGRAGPDVRVHMDDATNTEKVMRLDSLIEVDEKNNNGGSMKVLVLEGVEFQVSPEAHAAITSKIRKDSEEKAELKTKLDNASSETTKQQARADSLNDEVEKLKKQTPRMDDDQVQAIVRKRVALERFALTRLDSVDVSKLSDREIITSLIKLDNAEFDATGRDDVYLSARLDHMIETAKKTPAPTGGAHQQGRQVASARADASDKPLSYEDARRASQERSANAYQKRIGYGVK